MDRGATFVVRLALAPDVAAHVDSVSAFPPAQNSSFPAELAGLKVLVLDDELDARERVQSVLERGGATVTLASSTQEALATIRRDRPDIIVSDIGMPVEDGYTFIRELRRRSNEKGGTVPALALTAFARAEDRRKALVAGFQSHATKPIEPRELVSLVANLAGR